VVAEARSEVGQAQMGLAVLVAAVMGIIRQLLVLEL
jgi:hypothetical protein